MAGNYAQLLDIINNPTQHGLPAWDNNAKQIEGETIQQYLLYLVNSLTVGFQFMGVASTETQGGTPDQNVFYLAGAGTYNGFGGNAITINPGYIGVIKWNGLWNYQTIKTSDVEIGQYMDNDIEHLPSADYITIGDKSFNIGNNSPIFSFDFVGNGNTSQVKRIKVNPNELYKLNLSTNQWDVSGVSGLIFAINLVINGVGSNYHGILTYNIADVKNEYYVYTPDGCTEIYIIFKGVVGTELEIGVERYNLSPLQQMRKYVDSGNSNGTLFYKIPIIKGHKYLLNINFDNLTYNNVSADAVIFSVGYHDGTNHIYNGLQFQKGAEINQNEFILIQPNDNTEYFYVNLRADRDNEVEFQIIDIAEGWKNISYPHLLYGNNAQWMLSEIPLIKDHKYKIILSKNIWNISSIPVGQGYTIFSVLDSNNHIVNDTRGFKIDIVEGQNVDLYYFFICPTDGCKIGFRSDLGDSITVIFEDITDEMAGNVTENQNITFDIENALTILSNEDSDATQYDDARIFHPSIVQISDSMFYMYYGCMGKTDSGTDQSQHFCFAYSTNGTTWHRGFPTGVTPPFPNEENIIMHNVMEACVFRVWDNAYPFRMVVNKFGGAESVRMVYYKSSDGINWDESTGRVLIPFNVVNHVWGFGGNYSDTQPSCIVRGNYIKIYMRLWKTHRYIGTMVIDLDGNIVKIPSIEINIPKLYNPSGFAIDERRELLLPTDYIAGNDDEFAYRALLVDGKNFKELNSNINDLITSGIGWGYFASCMLHINNKQYVVLADQNEKHQSTAPLSDYVSQFKLIEIDFLK